jgi:dipicolinate synthase subunit B
MSTKNIYFIPYGQDDPFRKPNSMVARMSMLVETVEEALLGKQVQPVIIERFKDEN